MFYVYVLKSIEFDKRYIGMTQDLEKRLKEHNQKKTKSTKAFAPWEIIHSETFDNRLEARKREKYFKTAAGRRYLKKYLVNQVP